MATRRKKRAFREALGYVVLSEHVDGVHEIGRAATIDEAKEVAEKWAGRGAGMGVEWTSPTRGVDYYGGVIHIEPEVRAKKKERSIGRWDNLFETVEFEKFIGPPLGFSVNKWGEVVSVPDAPREEFWKLWVEIQKWLMRKFEAMNIEPYSAHAGEIYPSDVRELIKIADDEGMPELAKALSDYLKKRER